MAAVCTVPATLLMAAWNAYICLRLHPDLPTVFINLSFWLVPVLLLTALSGRLWPSFALGTTFTFVLQRLHWLKWRYLSATWTAADIRMALDVSNWTILQQYPYIFAFVLVCGALLVLSWLLAPRGRQLGWGFRALAAVACVVMISGDVRWSEAHLFDPFGFNTYGHFANLVFSASAFGAQPRTDGDSQLFVSRATDLSAGGETVHAALPDIVVWLQESTTDLRIYDIPGARLPVLSMHQPGPATREQGRLRVHSWGGSTWLSEFALLTGLSHEDFGPSGASVYYTVTPTLRFSMPKLLRGLGYRTVALTGAPKSFYNAEQAYRDLGFDDVLNPLDFPEWGGKSLENPQLVADSDLASYAKQVLARPREEPLFLFVLSVFQHGPYDPSHPVAYGLERSPLDRAAAARVSDYIKRLEITSAVAERLSEDLLGSRRSTMLVQFGDHQPNLETPLGYAISDPEAKYLTSYSIKTNFERRRRFESPAPLDVSYLGGVILEHAGLPSDAFFAANRSMRLLCQGKLSDCPDVQLRQSYNTYLFRDLRAANKHADLHAAQALN